MRVFRICICILCAFTCAGCMSLGATFDNKNKNAGSGLVDETKKVYVGTRIDAVMATLPFRKEFWTEKSGPGDIRLVAWIIGVVDLPLSLAMDTILLPYTISHDSRLENKRAE